MNDMIDSHTHTIHYISTHSHTIHYISTHSHTIHYNVTVLTIVPWLSHNLYDRLERVLQFRASVLLNVCIMIV